MLAEKDIIKRINKKLNKEKLKEYIKNGELPIYNISSIRNNKIWLIVGIINYSNLKLIKEYIKDYLKCKNNDKEFVVCFYIDKIKNKLHIWIEEYYGFWTVSDYSFNKDLIIDLLEEYNLYYIK